VLSPDSNAMHTFEVADRVLAKPHAHVMLLRTVTALNTSQEICTANVHDVCSHHCSTIVH
jgi:hypothetical protein